MDPSSPSPASSSSPRCISFHHSPEERCLSEAFDNTKFCIFHLKSLPKKSYKNIDDIDVGLDVEELNFSLVMSAYKKSQKVIIARTTFMEKYVSSEARDFGHHRRISLLMEFHQRCDQRLESMIVKDDERSEMAPGEILTETLPQILRDIRKSFVATKKKISDWKTVIDNLKEDKKRNRDLIEEIISLPEGSHSLLADVPYITNLATLSAQMFECDGNFYKETLRCFWHNPRVYEKQAGDDGTPLQDTEARKNYLTSWGAVFGCFRDLKLDHTGELIELIQNMNPEQTEKVRNTNVWSFMTQLWHSERVLGLNTSLKTGYNVLIDFKFYFFITLFFSDKAPLHFTIHFRKDGGWDVERVELKDIPNEEVNFRDYLTKQENQMIMSGTDRPWLTVNKESRKLVKRIIIASKLGKKGESIIENDVEKYNEFRRKTFGF